MCDRNTVRFRNTDQNLNTMTSRPLLAPIMLAMLFTACASKPIRLVTPCAGKDRATVVRDVSAIMATHGLTITMANESVGIVQGYTAETGGIFHDGRWQVSMKGDTVQATATMVLQHNTIYCDDATNEMYTWYWSVRRSLEGYCGAPIRFIEG